MHVLCVDDEPRVVQGLKLHLSPHHRVSTATSGAAALELLERDLPAAIISDLRMPDMDGTRFLSQARERAPETVRLLLTGQADLDAAIAAVNQAQVFRLLVKPCRPQLLLGALEEARAEHERLVAADRVRQSVVELLRLARTPPSWQTDLAAVLSRIGWVAVPPAQGGADGDDQAVLEVFAGMVAQSARRVAGQLGGEPGGEEGAP